MPSYLRIPKDEETKSPSSPDDDENLNSSMGLLSRNRFPYPPDSPRMTIWTILWRASLLLLLLGNFLLLAHHSLSLGDRAGHTHHRTYGEANMDSLDHKYDETFSTANKLGIIELPPWGPRGESLAHAGGGIGMFHQLHCLSMLRMGLQKFASPPPPYSSSHPYVPTGDDKAHWGHCLDYIRQGILCSADPTIELPRYDNGSVAKDVERYGVDGVRDLRVCRDEEHLWEMARAHGVWRDRIS